MKLLTFAASICALIPLGGFAQTPSPISLLAQPVTSEVCYFGGLAYSENALLVIEVPNRRDSPQSTQKALLECALNEQGDKVTWRRLDAE